MEEIRGKFGPKKGVNLFLASRQNGVDTSKNRFDMKHGFPRPIKKLLQTGILTATNQPTDQQTNRTKGFIG